MCVGVGVRYCVSWCDCIMKYLKTEMFSNNVFSKKRTVGASLLLQLV